MLVFTLEWEVLFCPLGIGLHRDFSAKCLEDGEVGFKGGALKRLTRNLVETGFSKWSGTGSLSVIGFIKLQGA